MDEVRRSGAETPGSVARLQPVRGRPAPAGGSDGAISEDLVSATGDELVGQYLAAVDRGDDLDSIEREALEQALDRLRRRGEDQQIVERLAACGFAGPFFEGYQSELIAYAVPVLMSWIRRGLIFYMCVERGRPVTAWDLVREHLATHRDDRRELVNETIANALKVFTERGLIRGGWTMEGGASLKTYLVGACINAFPNVFRRWLGEHDQGSDFVYGLDAATDAPGSNPLYPAIDVDPADAVASLDAVQTELARLDSDLKEIATRIAFIGETHAEVSQALGLPERAAEGRFYRYRVKRQARERNRKGGQHDHK